MKDADWFKVWFSSMPVSWQAGLYAAMDGKVFFADLEATGSHPPCKVIFCSDELGEAIYRALQDMVREQAT